MQNKLFVYFGRNRIDLFGLNYFQQKSRQSGFCRFVGLGKPIWITLYFSWCYLVKIKSSSATRKRKFGLYDLQYFIRYAENSL